MDFKERLEIVKDIVTDCPFQKQKKMIVNLFENIKGDIEDCLLQKLTVVDNLYSTNMNKRLFGLDEVLSLILEIEDQLVEDIDVKKFVKKNLNFLMQPVGIDKK